jgi:hypothetical protein
MEKENSNAEHLNEPEKFDSIAMSHESQQGWVESHDSDVLTDQLMYEMFTCKPDCESIEKLLKNKPTYTVEFLADNLPAVQFVCQFYLELIVHGGIIAKDRYNQEKLDKWLIDYNPLGQTNGNVVRQALLSSILYGYSGLRKVYSDLLYIAPNHFKIWKLPYVDKNGDIIPGIKKPLLYEIKNNRDLTVEGKEGENNVFTIDGKAYTLAQVVKEQLLAEAADGSFYRKGDDPAQTDDVFVTRDNFCHLRHSDEGTYGRSPLVTDRLRTTLIIDYIKNVIDEVNNDGNDYIMYLKQRGVVGSSLTSTISNSRTETVIKSSADVKKTKTVKEKQLGAARDLAKKLKRTAKTRIGIVSKDWVDEITKLEGTVRLNEYISILNDAKGVVADIYGIPALLAGSSGGGWSTGMAALIPFTLERTIKPFQQRYAEQLNRIVKDCAGINGDIKFKEINWEDEKTRAEIDKLVAETNKLIEEANNLKLGKKLPKTDTNDEKSKK